MKSKFLQSKVEGMSKYSLATLLMIFAFTFASVAQVPILIENFNSGSKPNGWVDEGLICTWDFSATGSYYTYSQSPSSPHSAPYCAGIGHSFYGSTYTQKLITPKMDMTNFKNVKVEFWHAQNQPYSYYYLSTMALYYKTSKKSSYWNKIADYTTPLANWTQEIESIPDDSLTNEMYFAFETKVQSDHGAQLDDVKITGTPTSGFDAKMVALESPVTWAAGTANTISVVAANWAADSIVSGIYGYQLDANSQVTETATFDTLWAGDFDTFTFTAKVTPASGVHNFKFWINNVNGKSDDDVSNDTIYLSFKTALSDTFYIGASTNADYSTIQDACDDLEAYGVSGPTVFMIEAGTYTEEIELSTVLGVSATNSVVFDGFHKDSVTITDNTSSSIWTLDKVDYITLKNMTIENTTTGDGFGIQLVGKCSYNNLLDLDVDMTTTSYNSAAILATSSKDNLSGDGDNANNTLVKNVNTYNTYYAIRFNGGPSTGTYPNYYADPYNMNNKVIDCQLTNFYYYGIYMYGQSGNIIHGNIANSNSSYSYGIYHYYSKAVDIRNNKIDARYAIYENYTGIGGDTSAVVNNMLLGDMYYYYCTNMSAYHNTVKGEYYNLYLSSTSNLNLYNNIFDGTAASYTVYLYSSSMQSEYNNYYDAGTFRVYTGYGNPEYSSLKEWQTADDKINNIAWSQNPQFTGTTDLHLNTSYQPLVGYNKVGVDVDFDGDGRCLYGPSIGADEVNYSWPAPVADFGAEDTVCYKLPVGFSNIASYDEPKAHKWYLNGTFVSDDLNWLNTFKKLKNDTIKLVTYSCGGVDSVTKIITVDTPYVKSTPEFVADNYIIEASQTVNFTDLSSDCPKKWAWTVSPREVYDPALGTMTSSVIYDDSDSTSQDPSMIFMYPGTYEVCLYVDNGKGQTSICKTDYIIVKASYNICDYAGTEVTQSGYGLIFDDGGSASDYANNNTCNVLIEPCAKEMTLTFEEFDIGSGDFLQVYDGKGGNALWDVVKYPNGLGGNAKYIDLGADTILTSYTGKMHFVWETDGSGTSAGFKAEWSSVPDTSAVPTASFTAQDTACVGENVQFYATATGENLTYSWDMDADGFTDQFSEDPEFQYLFAGTYKVNLNVASACNSNSVDVSKDIVVIQPNQAPKVDFSVSNTRPVVDKSQVTFEDLSFRCVDSWEWQISPSTYKNISGFPGTQTPIIEFSDTGCYDVTLIAGYHGVYDTLTRKCFIEPMNYCQPSVINTNPDVGISRVTFGTIDNKTAIGQDKYTSYLTTHSTFLELQAKYPITIERNTVSNAATRKVWIDWNLDGDFNDTLELVAEEIAANTVAFNAVIEVPSFAKTGTGVMRVAVSLGNLKTNPCGPVKYGEVEDYEVVISPDRTNPVVSLNGSENLELNQCDQYVDAGATAWDNIDGNITSAIITTNNLDISVPGNYTYVYSVTDAKGNEGIATRYITVKPDSLGPNVTIIGNVYDSVEVFNSWVDSGYTVTKRCEAVVSQNVDASLINTSVVGTYEVYYTAEDALGNITTAIRYVRVVDTQDPVVVLFGKAVDSVEVFGTYTDPGVSIADNYYANLSATVNGSVDVNTVGDYILEYSVTDGSGNGPVKMTRTVKVVDTEAPVLSSYIYNNNDQITLEVNSLFTVPKIGIDDNYYTGLTGTEKGTFFQKFSNGIASALGTYTYIFEVVDGSGNIATFTLNIEVVDTEAPEIKLTGADYVQICRFEEVPNDATVVDNFDQNLSITMGGTYISDYKVNMAPGYYVVTYDATDNSGNVADQVVRAVVVLDSDESPCLSGIDNTSLASAINVYPNPTSGVLHVSVSFASSSNLTIQVTNTLGQVVFTTDDVNVIAKTYSIDMNDQSAGLYYVKLQNEDNSIVMPVTVVR